MEITAKALRTRVRQLLEAVALGDEVTITYRGRPRAKVVPIEEDRSSEQGGDIFSEPLFGIWADRNDMDDVGAYVDRLRQGRF